MLYTYTRKTTRRRNHQHVNLGRSAQEHWSSRLEMILQSIPLWLSLHFPSYHCSRLFVKAICKHCIVADWNKERRPRYDKVMMDGWIWGPSSGPAVLFQSIHTVVVITSLSPSPPHLLFSCSARSVRCHKFSMLVGVFGVCIVASPTFNANHLRCPEINCGSSSSPFMAGTRSPEICVALSCLQFAGLLHGSITVMHCSMTEPKNNWLSHLIHAQYD